MSENNERPMYDLSESFDDESSDLFKKFNEFMLECDKVGACAIAHIGLSSNDNGIRIAGGMVSPNNWVPDQFALMTDMLRLDEEGLEFIWKAIRYTNANMAVKAANIELEKTQSAEELEGDTSAS